MLNRYKTILVTGILIVIISLVAAISTVEANDALDFSTFRTTLNPLIPPAQDEGSIKRHPVDLSDMIVQSSEDASLAVQSAGTQVAIVPGAAFIHTNEFGNGTEAEDWFFSFNGGYLTNDSIGNSGGAKTICLTAPVYLPVGSRLIGFDVYVYDNFVSEDISIFLDRTGSFGGWTELAAVQTAENSASIQKLTDPSIASFEGANTVAVEFNYHVNLCIPANSDDNIRVYGAQVNYLDATPGFGTIYLPVVLKPNPVVVPKSQVFISNLSGGVVNYTIQSTPEGNISCTVPHGAIETFCDKDFTAGTYQWNAQLKCGTLGPTPRVFTPGKNTLTTFRCD